MINMYLDTYITYHPDNYHLSIIIDTYKLFKSLIFRNRSVSRCETTHRSLCSEAHPEVHSPYMRHMESGGGVMELQRE